MIRHIQPWSVTSHRPIISSSNPHGSRPARGTFSVDLLGGPFFRTRDCDSIPDRLAFPYRLRHLYFCSILSTESVLLFFLFSVYQYFLPPYSSRTFLNVSISIVSVTVSLCICSEDLRAPINPPPPRSKSQPNLRHTTQPPHLPLKVSTRSLDRFLSTSPLFAFLPVFAFCFNFSDHLQRQLPLPCLHWIIPLIPPPSSPLS